MSSSGRTPGGNVVFTLILVMIFWAIAIHIIGARMKKSPGIRSLAERKRFAVFHAYTIVFAPVIAACLISTLKWVNYPKTRDDLLISIQRYGLAPDYSLSPFSNIGIWLFCSLLVWNIFGSQRFLVNGQSAKGVFCIFLFPVYYAYNLWYVHTKSCVEDGVLFNKEKTALVKYPSGSLQTSYTIPGSVTTIEDSAFLGCTNLTSVIIPNSVTTIGDSAFSKCGGLESLIIPHSVTTVGESAFSGCDSLKSLTISDGVATIGQSAFAGCKKLTSVIIPDSVTSIGGAAFAGCRGLTSVNAGDGNPKYSSANGILFNKSGDTLILYPCGRQNTCDIPNSVAAIGPGAFSGCAGLTTMIVNNPKPPKIRHDPFSGIKWDKLCLYVPQDSIDAYRAADWWMLFKHIKPLSAAPAADFTDYFPIPEEPGYFPVSEGPASAI